MTKMLTIDGVKQSVEEWALDYGIPVVLIETRLNMHWSARRAVTEPMLATPGARLCADALFLEEKKAQRGRGR